MVSYAFSICAFCAFCAGFKIARNNSKNNNEKIKNKNKK